MQKRTLESSWIHFQEFSIFNLSSDAIVPTNLLCTNPFLAKTADLGYVKSEGNRCEPGESECKEYFRSGQNGCETFPHGLVQKRTVQRTHLSTFELEETPCRALIRKSGELSVIVEQPLCAPTCNNGELTAKRSRLGNVRQVGLPPIRRGNSRQALNLLWAPTDKNGELTAIAAIFIFRE